MSTAFNKKAAEAAHRLTHPTESDDALAKALYEQQGRRNRSDGTASFHPAPWGELPEGSRDYWREQAAELSHDLPPEGKQP
jgi:hypothetical protein